MNKDSLLRLLPVARQDTHLVQLYINIGQQYEIGSDYEVAKDYYRRAGDLSEKLRYKKGIIQFAANYTYILNIQEKVDSSLVLNKYVLGIALEMNDPVTIAKCYTNVGSSFQAADIYDSAIIYYENAKVYLDKSGDAATTAKLNDIMQIPYRLLNQYDKAIEMGELALQYFRKSNDVVSLGIALSNLGTNYVSSGKIAKGKALFMESLEIAKAIPYPELEQSLLLNIGNVYLQTQIVDSLKKYFTDALILAKELDLPESIAIAYRGLAIEAMYSKDFVKAQQYADSALSVAVQHKLRKERVASLEALSSIFFAMHDIRKAEKILQESARLQDSLTGEELRRQVLITEKRFETQKKESQIKLQQTTIRQKSILNYIFAGGVLALALIIGLGYRTYSQKQRLQRHRITELETEKQLAATEAVLKGEEKERTRLAKDLHDGLGGMLSGIKYSFQTMKGNLILTPENQEAFERSMDMLDSSIKEMRRVAHNMMPEALVKFGLDTALRDFCADINQSGAIQVVYQASGMEQAELDHTTAITVFRVVQELVNNIIRHAGATTAIVQISKTNHEVVLTVEDNGKGFDTAVLKQSKGIGWDNIQSRIDFLKGKLDVQSTQGKGTSVLIELKVGNGV
ncbi:MAG TPA: histidine kinase [Agriterribacter sp.]|nr:histidine kinase [Agriterribacter sp.]